MKAKEKIYEKLTIIFNKNNIGVTTTELENYLDIKRSAISHYLNLLFEEKKVLKTNTRPVKYYPNIKNSSQVTTEKENDIFEGAIGYNGSLKTQIEYCKSAVVYPLNGLPIILRGKSGVGKSFMAWLIYKYAVDKKVIDKNAKFIELNCADYANNPELLSSVLFGHVEGAFTGADKNKKGLMDEADRGYLFLDEIHRLSYENQEKLFFYLDKGKFRRLGENDSWHTANIRFIFATTEDVEKTLLETFYRRIPVRVTIPDFQQRPLIERISLIYYFYNLEAKKLNKNIKINNRLINLLAYSVKKGNIGMLKNYIKLSCARAYKNYINDDYIKIDSLDLPDELGISASLNCSKDKSEFIYIEKDKELNSILNRSSLKSLDADVKKIAACNSSGSEIEFNKLMKLLIKKIRNRISMLYGLDINNFEDGSLNNSPIKFIYYKLKNELLNVKKVYGISLSIDSQNDLLSIFIYYLYKLDENLWTIDIHERIEKISKINHKAFHIANRLIDCFSDLNCKNNDMLSLLFSIVISEALTVNTKIQAIIVSHGDSTATSIAGVANTLCGTYVYEPFDMPITDDSMEIVKKVNNYIDKVDTTQGLILLVDMGSLEKMYEPIKNHLQGELLIINNVTTNIAIDIGLRIIRGDSFEEIISSSKNNIKTEVRYYEGIAQGDNIIISCISGLGIAQKLKTIFEKCLDSHKIEVIAMDYGKLKEMLQAENPNQFKRTKLIITTNELNTSLLPSINIENIISNNGFKILTSALNNVIEIEKLKKLSDTIIKFFSIEGIADNLNFLNPSIVVDEVENVIKQYELYYNASFSNTLRLNLYMHISIMIERLMVGKASDFYGNNEQNEYLQEFIDVSKNVFHNISEKYHINLPLPEILLIYEITSSELNIR